MRYLWKDIRTIVDAYEGNLPLAHYLKNYFKLNHRLGSRDRKMLSEMTYSWYRCSKGMDLPDFERKLSACLFLCSQLSHTRLFLPEEWHTAFADSNTDRLAWLETRGIGFRIDDLFPYSIDLSEGITREEWLHSMLGQPRLFLRVRQHRETILQQLHEAGIDCRILDENVLSLPNSAPIDKLLNPAWYVVQDYSSQQTGQWFRPRSGEEWYDCCAGAGGKSLLLKDQQPGVQLTVSDIRESILRNLTDRFRQYGHTLPTLSVLDVSDNAAVAKKMKGKKFDGIICDVPCTGSGTWARTPEQLYFFRPAFLEEISRRQQQILHHVLPLLAANGRLIYITCSVFREENEGILAGLGPGGTIASHRLIKGIPHQADSLFAAEVRTS